MLKLEIIKIRDRTISPRTYSTLTQVHAHRSNNYNIKVRRIITFIFGNFLRSNNHFEVEPGHNLGDSSQQDKDINLIMIYSVFKAGNRNIHTNTVITTQF